MNDKLTSVNVESFLNDHLERSEIVLLEEGKETNDILAIAEAKGYILKDSNDLAGFKTIYTFDTAANINKARLPKELLLKALPGIIGKPVDIDHNRIYVVGHYIDYRYIAAKHMVIAYGVFYKSNFGEEWAKAKELFKAGKLGTSYEIWCPKSKRKYLPDGTYVLTNIEIAGGGLMFKEKPAFPDAKVLELAMKHIDEQKELAQEYLIPTKKYESCELFFAAGYNYDAKVGNAKKTAVPAGEMLYIADALVGKPTVVNAGNNTPGSMTDLAQREAIANTGIQPAPLKTDNVAIPGPVVVACDCANCKYNFNLSAQTFQRKNNIDFYECSKADDMHQCPQCKAIVNRQGQMLHPPQVVDFGMSCPSCRSSNWRILNNNPDTADVKCMNCAKNFHLDFQKVETNSPISKFNFLREGNSSCPQCGNNIPYSTISNAEVKPLTCRKCGLHYGINLTRQGSSRKIERANEFVQQEENMAIAPTGSSAQGTPSHNLASVKATDKAENVELQKASLLDNTTQSSDKGGSKMSNNEEVKPETPTAEVKVETTAAPVVEQPVAEAPKVEAPVVETPKVEAPVAETPAPVVEAAVPTVEQPAAPVVEAEAALEVEDAQALEAEEALEVSKTLKAEDRDKLSNDDFAVVKTVKDKTGSKTVRKFPIHDKAHVQNALARLHQGPSRDGLKKLGVDPDAVITKVKAKGKKLGMEDAEIEGYCNASQGTDMQKVDKRGSATNPTEVVAASAEEPVVAKKIKVGDNSVEGMTPDQQNQMQNQLFANVKQAMKFRRAHKASMKNIKALKKAMADGVFCSVEDVEVIANMNIDGKKTTTVSDVGTGEKVTEAVTTGHAPAPEAKPITVELNDGDKAKAAADALKPAATGENVEPIVAPASPVANAEVKTEAPVVASEGEVKPAEVVAEPIAKVETTDLAQANAEIQALKEKNTLLETAAVKLIERRNALGEFGKGLSDKDILDDDKYEVAKIKAENKSLKHELNTSSAHLAETSTVRGEDATKDLASEIKRKAQKLY